MDQLFVVQHAWLIPVLPLIGAAIAGFFGARWLKQQSHWPIWLGVGASAVLALMLLFGTMGLRHDEANTAHADRLAAPLAGRSAASPEGGSETASAPQAGPLNERGDAGADTLSASKNYFTWIHAGGFDVKWGYFFDPLTVVMLCVVCGIGFWITVFAAGYMKGESGYFRFFAYLGLFIFMMTTLVMGENLVMLYLGWEGVGLCSYLLIGYYYERPIAVAAAKKAFIVNRIGDFGFALGIMLCFLAFGTISYFGESASGGLLQQAANTSHLSSFQQTALKWIPFLLMLGAFGKSAQFPLYVWLPDAMEGPTPVSALIHAATMVTAGVYMIARCAPLFVGNRAAMFTIACIGAFTALFAATIALRQWDLKKVFAYSTISQLGYMFLGVGVLAPTAAVFHLVTHAFFKALLFLSSGVVMHAMLGHLDMRKMSGLKRVLPWTNWLMLIGCAALAGFPLTSGFFSKDEIIAQTLHVNVALWLVAVFTAFLTAYYTFRLYFQVFHGPLLVPDAPADDHAHVAHDEHGEDARHSDVDEHLASGSHHHADEHHNHEPMLMILPLIVLAIGALLAGLLNWPGESLAKFLGQSPSLALGYSVANRAAYATAPAAALWGQEVAGDHPPLITWAMIIGGLVSIVGIYWAYLLHLKNRQQSEEIAARFPALTRLLEGKYWVDELYDRVIVEPLWAMGEMFAWFDNNIVDNFMTVLGLLPQAPAWLLRFGTQRGYLQGYAAAMLLGMAVILLFIFL